MAKLFERKSRKSDLPSESCPWIVYCYGKHMKDQIFCSISQPHKIYHKRIPQLSGDSEIVAHCSGWFLLSEGDDTHFSLWNPTISHSLIPLPPLSLKPTQTISHCFLSTPPGDLDCKVMLFENVLRSVIFIRPSEAAEGEQWTEIPYADLISSFTEKTDDFLTECASCNGKIYSSIRYAQKLVSLDVDSANHLAIEPLCILPSISIPVNAVGTIAFRSRCKLIECCRELLHVEIVLGGSRLNKVIDIRVYKIDFKTMVWERAENLMGQGVFFGRVGASSCPAFGNGVECDSIYFTRYEDKGLYSFNVRDGCLSVNLPCPSVPTPWSEPIILVPHHVCLSHSHTQMEYNSSLPSKEGQMDEKDSTTEEILTEKTRFSDLPLEILMEISNWLNLYDYSNFRLVCQNCHLAVPKIQRKQALQKLRECPPTSPMWLLLPNKDMTAFKFVDPIHGTSFLMNLPESLKGSVIRYSRNGWLLMSDGKSSIYFFTPFIEEIIRLPTTPEKVHATTYGMAFSSVPTSQDCLVIGCACFPPFDTGSELRIIDAAMGDRQWGGDYAEVDSIFWLNNSSPLFYKGSLYLLGLEGNLSVIEYEEEQNDLEIVRNFYWNVLRKPKTPCRCFHQSFLVECDGKLMSIFMGEMGKWVQVFSLNFNKMRWEKVESIGNHVIYLSGSACVSAEARVMGTENRIYFPRLHGNNILYYSLETKRIHLDSEDTMDSFYNTKEPLSAIWIQPPYS